MSWRDNLLDASFRGASFKIIGSSYSVGRRNELHEYINREKPYLNDHGKAADEFSVTGYIIQSNANDYDYFTARDNLISALKEKGSGILIHPFYGFKRVGLTGKATITESFDEGGIARFSMTFVESGERAVPTRIEDFLNKIDNAVNLVYDKIGDFFYNVYETTGAFTDVTANAVNKSISTIQGVFTGIQTIPTKTISEIIGNINSIKTSVATLLTTPQDVYNAIKDSCNSIAIVCGLGEKIEEEQSATSGTAGNNDLIVNDRVSDTFATSISISSKIVGGEIGGFSGISRGEIVELDGETIPDTIGKSLLNSISDVLVNFETNAYNVIPSEQTSNVVMIFHIMKFCLFANACRIAMRTDFFSQEDITQYRELIMDRFEEFLLDLGAVSADGSSAISIGSSTIPVWNQDIFLSIEDLRDIFAEGMTNKISESAKIIDHDIGTAGDNCLTLAYDKYGDLDRYLEIFKRNKNDIRHPGFIKPGSTIRILEE